MNSKEFLDRAAALAAPWMTFPNPRVGCVIVNDAGEIVGEGAHHRAGDPHAEVNALAEAGDAALGSTAYVTLEPCAHAGRTGPCTQALIDAGIARVVIGSADPNPIAAGGAALLRAAGVTVEFVESPTSHEVNEHWLFAMRVGRPFVTLKMATSLDGRVAAADGVETAISNEASRVAVHALRSRVDAVLIGTNTALVDNPQLNVREVPCERQPARFVMGQRVLPPHLAMFTGADPATQIASHDPVLVLRQLHERGIRHVLLEGGPTLARVFVEAGLVNELVWITAPLTLGNGPQALGETALTHVSRWARVSTQDIDGDLWSILRPAATP